MKNEKMCSKPLRLVCKAIPTARPGIVLLIARARSSLSRSSRYSESWKKAEIAQRFEFHAGQLRDSHLLSRLTRERERDLSPSSSERDKAFQEAKLWSSTRRVVSQRPFFELGIPIAINRCVVWALGSLFFRAQNSGVTGISSWPGAMLDEMIYDRSVVRRVRLGIVGKECRGRVHL